LKGWIAIPQTAHVVEPFLSVTIGTAPWPTHESHDCATCTWELYIFTRLIGFLIEFCMNMVDNILYHSNILSFKLAQAWSFHNISRLYIISLMRWTSQITKVFSEIVVACGTGHFNQLLREGKVGNEVSDLPCTAADPILDFLNNQQKLQHNNLLSFINFLRITLWFYKILCRINTTDERWLNTLHVLL
jgi:hypothetical protein